MNQCKRPSGWLGRLILRNMNARHSRVTGWGLAHITVRQRDTILDVGCGGGRTIGKLAALAREGKVYGIDHAEASVAVAVKTNRQLIEDGRVQIQKATVSQLPFAAEMFDLVTAVETHFWWPDLPEGMREIRRVLKPGGRLIIIAEVYRGATGMVGRLAEKHLPSTGLKLLTIDEHRALFVDAGFTDIEIGTEPAKGWIWAVGRQP